MLAGMSENHSRNRPVESKWQEWPLELLPDVKGAGDISQSGVADVQWWNHLRPPGRNQWCRDIPSCALQQHPSGSLKLAVMEEFISWKLTSATSQFFFSLKLVVKYLPAYHCRHQVSPSSQFQNFFYYLKSTRITVHPQGWNLEEREHFSGEILFLINRLSSSSQFWGAFSSVLMLINLILILNILVKWWM